MTIKPLTKHQLWKLSAKGFELALPRHILTLHSNNPMFWDCLTDEGMVDRIRATYIYDFYSLIYEHTKT